ncbi:MAG: HPP family protein [Thermoleophilia bacterium]
MDKPELEITDDDIRSAQKDLKSYVDVTDEDLRLIYGFALKRASERLTGSIICPAAQALLAPRENSEAKPPPGVGMTEIFWSFLGALLGIGLCAWLSSYFFEPRDLTLIIGSFGASAVLIYGVIKSPFSQPRNLIGGHILSAFIGVTAWEILGGTVWLAAAVAVSLAVAAMLATNTVHPPGGATALIAVIGGQQVHDLGWLYPVLPVGAGALVLLLVALLVNKIAGGRKYPEYWI